MRPGKSLLAKIISVLPTATLRSLAYRIILKYRIVDSHIGFGTIICVDKAEIVCSRIGRYNRFLGPMSMVIHDDAVIGSCNKFICGAWTLEARYQNRNFERHLEIGEKTLITDNHYFDVTGAFSLGSRSCIAGYNSQFWTHGGVNVADRNIEIGQECYIGSAVRFCPGAGVGDHVLVGMGSVVTRTIDKNHAVVAGVPAAVIRENYDWKERKQR